MGKFKNKYRIEPARLKNWDYAQSAVYFVTICTANRDHFLGEIENQKMIPSTIGNIVEQEWVKTPEIRPDMKLELGEFVVMPNHFHGILFIGNNEFNGRDAMHGVSAIRDGDAKHGVFAIRDGDAKHGVFAIRDGDAKHGVFAIRDGDAKHRVSTDDVFKNEFGPQSKNLASIIRGFKSAITVRAKDINPEFGWQARFHDHIIRNPKSHDVISQYIIDNPLKWIDDEFNK